MSKRKGRGRGPEGFQRRQAEAGAGVQVKKDICVRDAIQPVNPDFETRDDVRGDFGIGGDRR